MEEDLVIKVEIQVLTVGIFFQELGQEILVVQEWNLLIR